MRKSIFRDVNGFLDGQQRKKGATVVGLMVLSALLDFFSLASFLPLLMVVVNPAFLTGSSFITRLYHGLQFTSTSSFVITLTLCVLLLVMIKSQINKWISREKAGYAFEIGNDLALRKLGHYLEMNYQAFSEVDFTKELSRISTYPIAFANNIILPGATLITETIVSVLFLLGVAIYDFQVLALVFIILVPIILIFRSRRKSLREINQDLKEKYPLLSKYALQLVEGFSEIKAYKKEDFFLERFKSINQNIIRTLQKDQFIQNSTVRITEVAMGVVICSLVIYSVSTRQDYQQTLVLLGLYAGASFRVLPSINRILHALQQIRIHDFLFDELKVSIDSRPARPKLRTPPLAFLKSVEFRNISFGYTARPPILQDVSLLIRKGEKIGLTGKSGEGKTTLLLILLQLLKTSSGEIFVDGKLVTDQNAWQSLLGYVAQNPYVLDGTIAENIAFGLPTQSIDITKVSTLIQELELTEMTEQLPEGIQTRIGERGIKLSGGQVQRLAIARALYADAQVLLLDEITNQLHPSAELEIMNLLDRLASKGKTIIMVTHKLPHPGFFDSIYHLQNGKLAANHADSVNR